MFAEDEIIDFSFDWNGKVSGNVCFTTLRLHNDSKYVVGKVYGIRLKGEMKRHPAILLDKKVLYMKDLNEWVARIDTGYSLADFKGLIYQMYKNKVKNIEQQRFDLLLLRYDRAARATTQLSFEDFRTKHV